MPPWALDFIIILWLGASQSPLVRILSLLIFVLRYKQSLQLNNEVQLTGLPFTRPPFPTFEDLCRVGGRLLCSQLLLITVNSAPHSRSWPRPHAEQGSRLLPSPAARRWPHDKSTCSTCSSEPHLPSPSVPVFSGVGPVSCLVKPLLDQTLAGLLGALLPRGPRPCQTCMSPPPPDLGTLAMPPILDQASDYPGPSPAVCRVHVPSRPWSPLSRTFHPLPRPLGGRGPAIGLTALRTNPGSVPGSVPPAATVPG